jgi:hypothetical protein
MLGVHKRPNGTASSGLDQKFGLRLKKNPIKHQNSDDHSWYNKLSDYQFFEP